MILLIGSLGAGKRAYAHALGYGDGDFAKDGAVVASAQDLVRDDGSDPIAVAERLAKSAQVVICDDVGGGIVPIDAGERAWRERAGTLARELATRASTVVRLVCGIPTALKGPLPFTNGTVRLAVMRHGTTPANERHAYAGSIDVPLSPDGERQAREAGVFPQVENVYVSSLQRARRTAEICFPEARQQVFDGLREMDFGVFENRRAADMEDDPEYRAWVDSMCEDPCPEGESRAMLVERVARALEDVVRDAMARGDRQAIVVGHGGTVMAAMDAFCDEERGYFDWHVGNCEGYVMDASFDDGALRLSNWERFHDLGFVPTEMVKAPCGEEASAETAPPRFEPHLFFSNRACKYFPCHEGIDEQDFNCLFCYCPLYALGPDCGGNFTYTKSGRKNCVNCTVPHMRDSGAKLVQAHYEQLAQLASRQ